MPKSYYNEFCPFAAAWLRELMADGLIPQGDLDERSIVDVQPSDLAGYTQCHFFAGIGGWSAALRLAGWGDDRSVWTGSAPCQPFSVAGKGKGSSDERHLWPEFARLIKACRPPVVFGEQVASSDVVGTELEAAFVDAVSRGDCAKANKLAKQLVRSAGFRAEPRWLDGIFADLEGINYTCRANDLPAACVGAPHIRQRLYWVADAGHGHDRRQGRGEQAGRGELGGDGWQPVVFSAECNEDGDCPNCGIDYAECECIGPTEDDVEYEEREGVLYGRRMVQSSVSRLEGYAGDGDDRNQSGRIGEEPRRSVTEAGSYGPWSDYRIIQCRDGKARRIPVESDLFPLAHGIPNRVGILRGAGNAIVPQVAAEFIKTYCEAIEDLTTC